MRVVASLCVLVSVGAAVVAHYGTIVVSIVVVIVVAEIPFTVVACSVLRIISTTTAV